MVGRPPRFFRPSALPKTCAAGASQLQGHLGRYGIDVGDTAYAVGAEKFTLFAHDFFDLTVREDSSSPSGRDGFFSTFWAMRYHRAPARIRHVSFGPQLFVRICLIVIV